MKALLIFSTAVALLGSALHAEMNASLQGDWTGKKIPKGEQCKKFGGNGATPPIKITGIPKGTVEIEAEFNDRNFQPLSYSGGHGIIGFAVKGDSVNLPKFPGETADKKLFPKGSRIIKNSRARINGMPVKGYLPPCSGGRNNLYQVLLKARSKDGKVLEQIYLTIGRY